MELVKTAEGNGLFFPKYEFSLVDGGQEVCHLVVAEVVEQKELDVAVITKSDCLKRGYATSGLKLLMEWAAQNKYQKIRLTDLSRSKTILRLATKLKFIKTENSVWSKSLTGSLT